MTSIPSTHLGWVKEPESIAGLSRLRPNADQHPVIAGRYDKTPKGGRKSNPSGPWIWCSHCQEPTHWVGFVVVDDAGHFYLIGQDCGAKHYGGDRFRDATRRFESIEYAQSIDRRLAAIASLASAVETELTLLVGSDALSSIERKRIEIQAASPEAARRLATHTRSGLSLSTHERGRGLRGADFIPVNLGALEGGALIHSDLRARCSELMLAVGRAVSLNEDSASQTTNDKAKLVFEVEGLARSALKAAEECSQAHRFFLRRNYRRLARWSAPMRRFYSISHDEETLVIDDADQGVSRIEPIDAPRFPQLKACRQLLDNEQ